MSWIYEQEFEDLADTGDFIICSNISKNENIVNYENIYLLFKMEDRFDQQQKGLFVLSPGQTELDIIMGTWE